MSAKPPTLYIAGPMSGLPDHNYPAFRDAASLLRGAGYEVLSPVDNEKKCTLATGFGGYAPWSWYMRRSLEQIAIADGIALLPRWRDSKGASLEVDIALQLGMKIATLDAWLHDAATASEATR